MSVLLRLCICVLLTIGAGTHLLADNRPASAAGNVQVSKRIALVIGNSAYRDSPLRNPTNDAKDLAAVLRRLGFDVVERTDASQKEMNLAIAQFGEKLRSDTVALFFYAGHGMQVKGKNYIIPVDAQITSEATVRAMAVDVDTVLDQLQASPMNIVILDACRNNPFERRFRSVGGGLAQMDAPKGSLIAYATAPGKTAADGDGRNGLYTQELLKHIQTPGLQIEAVFKRVRNGVMAGSGEAQTPWESSSLTGDFYFQAPEKVTPLISAASDAKTPWLTIAAFQREFEERVRIKQYPTQLEGQYLNGQRMYRGLFQDYPKGDFKFYSRFGMKQAVFDTWNVDYSKQGFKLLWKQSFADSDGTQWIQATWSNAP